MAAQKRIVITDKETVTRLNLMAAMLDKDPTDLATEAANALWAEKGKEVVDMVSGLSPVAEFIETVESDNEADSKIEE